MKLLDGLINKWNNNELIEETESNKILIHVLIQLLINNKKHVDEIFEWADKNINEIEKNYLKNTKFSLLKTLEMKKYECEIKETLNP